MRPLSIVVPQAFAQGSFARQAQLGMLPQAAGSGMHAKSSGMPKTSERVRWQYCVLRSQKPWPQLNWLGEGAMQLPRFEMSKPAAAASHGLL